MELQQRFHGYHKLKKGTLNCDVAENAFQEMLQAVAPLLDSVYNVHGGQLWSEGTFCSGHWNSVWYQSDLSMHKTVAL